MELEDFKIVAIDCSGLYGNDFEFGEGFKKDFTFFAVNRQITDGITVEDVEFKENFVFGWIFECELDSWFRVL